MEYYSAIKKEWNFAIATTWMDLENTMLSETREIQILHGIIYMWDLKNNTNEFICKTETDPTQPKKINK